MEEAILVFIEGLHKVVPTVLTWVGLAASVFVAIAALTPWKGDDKALEEIKKIPLLGGLWAALLGRSPFNKK
jgi:hypothetical protein